MPHEARSRSLNLRYVFDERLPGTGADTEQVVNTVAALGRQQVNVRLLIPGTATGAGDFAALSEYYHVTGKFGVDLLRIAAGPRAVEKWSHAVRATRDSRVQDADLIYTRNLPALFCFLRRGYPVAYEHFRPWPDQFPILRPALRWMFRQPNLVAGVFHSAHTRDSFLRLGAPAERCLVAHNGWDPARMRPELSKAAARVRIGVPETAAIAVYTGRMNRKKGLDLVLEAARRLPEVLFVLVGSEGEGPIETEARTIANTRTVPWQRFGDLAPYLYAADVLLIPPSLEPLERHGNTVLPIKLFLYLAAGRAILAPTAPDTAELLSNGHNAALVPPGDIEAMVNILRRLVSDPAYSSGLGAQAREMAQSLTWDHRAVRIRDFLASRLSLASC
ncbi:MAG TPA: glycosyltransferase [Gemmatimonadales bacterium]|nr:glycosyltransferase [Gemmatimonadales bacterium]